MNVHRQEKGEGDKVKRGKEEECVREKRKRKMK